MFEEQGDGRPSLGEEREGLVMGDVTENGVIDLDQSVTDENIPEIQTIMISGDII